MPPRITLEERERRAAAAAAKKAGTAGAAAAAANAPVTRAELNGLSRKLDVLADQLIQLVAQGQAAHKGNEAEEEEEEYVEEEEPVQSGAPFRGSFGECPPPEERYAFLDLKVMEKAMEGHLPGEKLPLLIPPASDIYNSIVGDELLEPESREYFEGSTKASTNQIAARFVKAIPNIAVFVYAWANLIDLMIYGCGEPESASEIFVSLNWHAQWMIENSSIFTWESLVRYHIKVANQRFSGDFHVTTWYNNYDGASGTCLIRKDTVRAPAQASNNAGPSSGGTKPKKRPAAGNKSADTCMRYNLGNCPLDDCPRKHACSTNGCGGKHPAIKCPKNKSG